MSNRNAYNEGVVSARVLTGAHLTQPFILNYQTNGLWRAQGMHDSTQILNEYEHLSSYTTQYAGTLQFLDDWHIEEQKREAEAKASSFNEDYHRLKLFRHIASKSIDSELFDKIEQLADAMLAVDYRPEED